MDEKGCGVAGLMSAREYFGRSSLTLFHGSRLPVERPAHGKGNPRNDYGLGFYCTESMSLAKEWACADAAGGYANEYRLELDGLKLLDLTASGFTTLNWIAVLLENRLIDKMALGMHEACDFLIGKFGVGMNGADLVFGYRADDSYFAFARGFVSNQIPLEVLERALFLGGLGYQTVLKTPAAFEALSFVEAHKADGTVWAPRRAARDKGARDQYQALAEEAYRNRAGRYLIDIMREGA